MRKYVTLFFVTIITVVSIVFAGNYKKLSIKTVETICLKPTKAENFIVCSGKIEYSDTHEIFVEQPCIIKDFCVKVGDNIKKDDILAYTNNNKNIDTNVLPSDIENIKNIPNLKEVYSSFIKSKGVDIEQKQKEKINFQELNIFPLKSPFDGYVSSVNSAKGSIADKNCPVLTISESPTFQVKLSVAESKSPDIMIGQKVIITSPGFKNGEKIGKIKSISNEAKQIITPTGSETVVEVVVGMDDQDNNADIKPGFTAKCKIITDEQTDLLIVPYETVKADEVGKEYIYIYENGKAVKNYINTGKEFETGFEVVSGILETDKIITTPDSIKDKSFVKLIREECNN